MCSAFFNFKQILSNCEKKSVVLSILQLLCDTHSFTTTQQRIETLLFILVNKVNYASCGKKIRDQTEIHAHK